MSFITESGDCDDEDATINPQASELCDSVDRNCDGSATNGAVDTTTFYLDDDGDGFAGGISTVSDCTQPPNSFLSADDCNDGDATINPQARQLCDSGDRNCDGSATNGAVDTTTFYLDDDGDGFGDNNEPTQSCSLPGGYAENNSDCDDNNPNINPAATEICNNSDDDCNNQIDDNATDASTFYLDDDNDGFGDPNSTAGSMYRAQYFQLRRHRL